MSFADRVVIVKSLEVTQSVHVEDHQEGEVQALPEELVELGWRWRPRSRGSPTTAGSSPGHPEVLEPEPGLSRSGSATNVGSPQLQPQVSKAQLHFSICARRTFPPLFKASQAQQRSLTTRLWLEAVIGQRNSWNRAQSRYASACDQPDSCHGAVRGLWY